VASIIQTTADGSHTLFVPELNESYHSIHGAIRESTFIFIEQGLKQCSKNDIRVLEIGFGTGLNALLTSLEAVRTKKRIHYTALELYPVPEQDILLLNYPELLENAGCLFDKIHRAPWETAVKINPFFVLQKIKTDFTTYPLTGMYDVVYFDPFSPEKQPEMWQESGFQKIDEHCNSEAILTTYCAKGSVRRLLQNVGFLVERLPGPPEKREILRGRKLIKKE
jgi:tRNA U34 5-methylaminomethyl-2-thiouridine-forming methyltransferase MnmC